MKLLFDLGSHAIVDDQIYEYTEQDIVMHMRITLDKYLYNNSKNITF